MLPIHFFWQAETGHDRGEHGALLIPPDFPVDPPGRQELREGRDLIGGASRLVQEAPRHGDPVGHRPLPYFDRIEVQALVRLVDRQAARGDPPPDLAFIDPEKGGGLPDGELHPFAQLVGGLNPPSCCSSQLR